MIASRLRARSNGCGTCLSCAASAALGAKLHPHQERPLLLFRRIQHRLGLIPRTIPRTIAAAQSGVISAQANSLQPSVPEAELGIPASPWDAAAAAGFASPWMWAPREMTTVEIACLKMSCSWLLVSRTTEYLSNDRIRPVSFTPLTR